MRLPTGLSTIWSRPDVAPTVIRTPLAAVVGTALVATMLAMAIVEHLLLVLPFPSTALWRWALRGGAAVATPRPVAANVKLETHEDLFRAR